MGRTTTPAQEGHAGLSPAADRAGMRIVDRLARSIGHQSAVAWVHAGAVLAWSQSHGAFTDAKSAATAAGIRDGIKMLADAHPALAGFVDPKVNALWLHDIGDGDAAAIHALWQEHPVTDPDFRPHGYLLGNAYQALSEESRKHRALAQTPRYVTDLLLELAFRPAADEHGIGDLKMIDPSCGTGHILMEAFIKASNAAPTAANLERALRVVHGVDLDPYAALIARLRLVVMVTAILRGNRRSRPELPSAIPADWPINVGSADALLDRDEPLLKRGSYHVVIGNPPYVTPKTAQQRDAVRAAYPQVCNGKYALSLPFHQLMTELLVPGGWCAQLTANSFMKREFGKRFVEKYLPQHDLRWVIDTSGAYIPGHGTPTVILVHRNRAPVGDTVSAVLGIRGEPSAPADPSQGVVWRAIEESVHSKLSHQRLAAALERESGAEQPDRPPAPVQSLPPARWHKDQLSFDSLIA